MKRTLLLLAALAITASWIGCKKKVARSPIPHIADEQLLTDSLDSLNYNFVHFGHIEDTVKIFFTFTDGDADLGSGSSGVSNICLKDNRDSSVAVYPFPEVPDQLLTPDEGEVGRAVLFLQAIDILSPVDTNKLHTGDTVKYELFVKDRAGNESNHVPLPPLRLKPQ